MNEEQQAGISPVLRHAYFYTILGLIAVLLNLIRDCLS
jgi:hypothetical protein